MTIKDDDQLMNILILKDELIHIYNELRFSKDTDYEAFKKLDNRLNLLNRDIESYIEESSNCFQIKCFKNVIIEPQKCLPLKTNVSDYDLQNTYVEFRGSIPSAGCLKLFRKDNDFNTDIYVKNNIPREALEKWELCGYQYNDPMITRYIEPGVYEIKKDTVVAVGYSKDKELVKSIKR